MRRLLTLPGIDAVSAAAFMAAVGDVRRFPTPGHFDSYLGLDPRVRQSGSEPARHGRISKQGPSDARHVLVEAAWRAGRETGPLRAFCQRVAAKRGTNVATVAAARRLVLTFNKPQRGRLTSCRRLHPNGGTEQRQAVGTQPFNTPVNVPWKLVAGSPDMMDTEPDMMDTEVDDRRLPRNWRPLLANPAYEHPLEGTPEENGDIRLTYAS